MVARVRQRLNNAPRRVVRRSKKKSLGALFRSCGVRWADSRHGEVGGVLQDETLQDGDRIARLFRVIRVELREDAVPLREQTGGGAIELGGSGRQPGRQGGGVELPEGLTRSRWNSR